jgi:hypothetical protein
MQSALGRDRPLGERLTGCYQCNRWQALAGEWCRLAPDDIMALRAIKSTKTEIGAFGKRRSRVEL